MPKYRRIPKEFDAVQFRGGDFSTAVIEKFMGVQELMCNKNGTSECQELIIPTEEGELTASAGDFIVKGYTEALGWHYWPVKEDFFNENYEKV